MLAHSDFLQEIKAFDAKVIPDETLKEVDELIALPFFNPETMAKKVKVAGELASWVINCVRYHKVYVKISPPMAKDGNGEDHPPPRPPPVVVVLLRGEGPVQAAEAQERLRASGADAVVLQDGPLEGGETGNVRDLLARGLTEAWSNSGLSKVASQKDLIPQRPSPQRAELLFDARKCKTGNMEDLMCAGGLLDLVRGSITCSTEQEVKEIYTLALGFTVEHDRAEVLRVKNCFHTPGQGGYCDLKMFMRIADGGGSKDGGDVVWHICELQVHLERFLAKKKYTHMPYVIGRGDFDHSDM